MVIFYTSAFNGEKTLVRAIESVLNQSYQNFLYYVLNNASTDKTGEIIRKFAEKDNRVIMLENKVNNPYEIVSLLPNVFLKEHGDAYFANLDADDEYSPDFLEKMLAFMKEYDLEVAACGNDFIDAQKNNLIGVRKLGQNLIVEGDGFGKDFQKYHQFMRTVWGKVYRLSVLRKCNLEKLGDISYGGDTVLTMQAFLRADQAGILAESLHKYYIYPKSVSSQFDAKRIASDQILFDVALDFLTSKCDKVSEENLIFLYKVYFNAISDTISVLISSQISIVDKLNRLRDIFESQHTKALIQMMGNEVKKSNLFNQVAVWVLSQKEVCNEFCLEIVADIMVAIGLHPASIGVWQDGWVFMLQVKIKDRLLNNCGINNIDEQIASITFKNPLLDRLSADFIVYYPKIIFLVLQHEEQEALNQVYKVTLQEKAIPEQYIEAFLTLGLNLAARLEDSNRFIYLKKLQISSLIELKKFNQAEKILADWDEILPNDMDFKELRVRLTQ